MSDISISDYAWGYDSPNGLLTENFTAISRGYGFSDDGKQSRGVAKALLGN